MTTVNPTPKSIADVILKTLEPWRECPSFEALPKPYRFMVVGLLEKNLKLLDEVENCQVSCDLTCNLPADIEKKWVLMVRWTMARRMNRWEQQGSVVTVENGQISIGPICLT